MAARLAQSRISRALPEGSAIVIRAPRNGVKRMMLRRWSVILGSYDFVTYSPNMASTPTTTNSAYVCT
jgi:hypothetical protein